MTLHMKQMAISHLTHRSSEYMTNSGEWGLSTFSGQNEVEVLRFVSLANDYSFRLETKTEIT